MIEILLVIVSVTAAALVVVSGICLLLAKRVRDLTISVECLCINLGGLREQIGYGGHGHG